jgi:hypothetical protein
VTVGRQTFSSFLRQYKGKRTLPGQTDAPTETAGFTTNFIINRCILIEGAASSALLLGVPLMAWLLGSLIGVAIGTGWVSIELVRARRKPLVLNQEFPIPLEYPARAQLPRWVSSHLLAAVRNCHRTLIFNRAPRG